MVDATRFMRESEQMLTGLYKIAYCILRSQADAEDAVQQGLMKAWAAKEKAKPDSFRAWVSRIVINEARNIQRYRMRVTPTDTLAMQGVYDPPDTGVMEAVIALPEKLLSPFSLKYVGGYSEREVADTLHLPLSTVKKRLAKARQTLRDKLTEEA